MANEVIIEEYAAPGTRYPDGQYAPVVGKLLTSQVLNIAAASAAFNVATTVIRIQSKDTGFWYTIGGNSPNAVANTAGNRWLPADQFRDIAVTNLNGVEIKVDTAA